MENIFDIYTKNIDNIWLVSGFFMVVVILALIPISFKDLRDRKREGLKKSLELLKSGDYKRVSTTKPALIIFFLIILDSFIILYPIFWNGAFPPMVLTIFFFVILIIIYFLKNKAGKIIYVKNAENKLIALEKKD